MVKPSEFPPPFDVSEAIALPTDPDDQRIEVGVAIVGAGPAGLACAIRLGQLLDEHWQNKKRRAEAITDGRIDEWYALAKQRGALGGKVIGAGGGGFLMLYCPGPSRAAVRQALTAAGLKEMPVRYDFDGAKVLVNF